MQSVLGWGRSIRFRHISAANRVIRQRWSSNIFHELRRVLVEREMSAFGGESRQAPVTPEFRVLTQTGHEPGAVALRPRPLP